MPAGRNLCCNQMMPYWLVFPAYNECFSLERSGGLVLAQFLRRLPAQRLLQQALLRAAALLRDARREVRELRRELVPSPESRMQ